MGSVYPVPKLLGVNPSVSQGYGPRAAPKSGHHDGLDIMYRRTKKGATDLPVYAPWYHMPGGVSALAFQGGTVTRASYIGTGGRVEIDHGAGLTTKYYHLRNLRVKTGQPIEAGQPVGEIYHNTKGYRLNHLHFETLIRGKHVNPEPILAGASWIDAAPAVPVDLYRAAATVAALVLLSRIIT